MHLLPWDYFADARAPNRGLSQVAGLIAAARAEVPGSVLVDNGDFLQGSALGDLLAETAWSPRDGLNPMITAMNHLAYDAAALGNHEFSHGLDYLNRAVAQARFPMLSANIAHQIGAKPPQDQLFAPATALVTRMLPDGTGTLRPLRLGVVGLTPPQTVRWDQEILAGKLEARDMVQAASHHLDQLRAQGADLVLALAHSGFGNPDGPAGSENNVLRLARDLGFDALVAGHTHQRFPLVGALPEDPGLDPVRGLVHGKPVVMPGFFGSHLGVIDLSLHFAGGRWQVVQSQAHLRAVSRVTSGGHIRRATPADPQVESIARAAHDQTRRWSRRTISQTSHDLTSWFALVAPCPSVRLVAAAQADHVAQALRGSVWAGLPILSAAAPFRTGGRGGPDNYTEVRAGPISLRNIADLYQFPNTIIALQLTGAEVADWLERSAALYNHIPQGTVDAELINPDMPGFDFDSIEGLSYEINLSIPPRHDAQGALIRPDAQRIQRITHAGQPLDPGARFILATNSFRIGGGGNFAAARPDRVVLRASQSHRGMLAAYVSRLGQVPRVPPPNWRFAALPGTSATFVTSPRAPVQPDGFAHLHLSPLDLTPEGFRRFRLTL